MIKKLHLTCKDKNNIDNDTWKRCIEKYKEIYNDYEIIIYDNNDIYNIIEKNAPIHLEIIKQIKIGPVLADVFRYLILYLEGGIYSDMDCEPLKKIDDLVSDNYQYFHGGDDNFIYIYPRNKNIVSNVCDFHKNICDNCQVQQNDLPIKKYKCLGHKINNASVLVSCEYSKDWIDYPTELYDDELKFIRTINGSCVCQWFIISKKPKHDLFLKMYNKCISNIDKLINLDKNSTNYQFDVLTLSGPMLFTTMINDTKLDEIFILPADFFCCGSWNNCVPQTKNSFVKHHYTSVWL